MAPLDFLEVKMKNIVACQGLLVLAILTLIFMLPFICSTPKQAEAQIYGTNYLWQDAISITTAAIDSHFVTKWQDVSFWSSGCGLSFRCGAEDTTSWSSRDWIVVEAGQTIQIGPATKLVRLEFKASSGSGTMYILGYKKSDQY